MSHEQVCDELNCLQPAIVFIGNRLPTRLAWGYFACAEHQAEGFWQVVKVALRQEEDFNVVLLDVAAVENLGNSRA